MPCEKQFDTGEVLNRAMRAFWHRGYEGTSMQDLVACTGVNRASLYATYGDKRALFLASLRAFAETVHLRRLEELETAHSPRSATRESLVAFVPRGETRLLSVAASSRTRRWNWLHTIRTPVESSPPPRSRPKRGTRG